MAKIAWVLSGGGAKGAFQVGVIKKLQEQGIKPDTIYGTSVGAINAAGYAYGQVDGLLEDWYSIQGAKWYKPWTPSADILAFNWSVLGLGASDGLFNTSPLREHLVKRCVGKPVCEAQAVRVNINSGVVDYVSNMNTSISDFIDGVEGSACIPGIMSPQDGQWVDGGVRQVVPIQKAVKDGGYDKIYVLLCNPLTINPTDPYDVSKAFSLFKFLGIAYRAIDGILEHQIFVGNAHDCFNNKSGIPFEIYAPSVIPCSTLQFDPDIIRKTIDVGYAAKPIMASNI